MPPLRLRLLGDCSAKSDASGACQRGMVLRSNQEPDRCPSTTLTPSPSASPPRWLLITFVRPIWLRLILAATFIAPAAIAGFHATHGCREALHAVRHMADHVLRHRCDRGRHHRLRAGRWNCGGAGRLQPGSSAGQSFVFVVRRIRAALGVVALSSPVGAMGMHARIHAVHRKMLPLSERWRANPCLGGVPDIGPRSPWRRREASRQQRRPSAWR